MENTTWAKFPSAVQSTWGLRDSRQGHACQRDWDVWNPSYANNGMPSLDKENVPLNLQKHIVWIWRSSNMKRIFICLLTEFSTDFDTFLFFFFKRNIKILNRRWLVWISHTDGEVCTLPLSTVNWLLCTMERTCSPLRHDLIKKEKMREEEELQLVERDPTLKATSSKRLFDWNLILWSLLSQSLTNTSFVRHLVSRSFSCLLSGCSVSESNRMARRILSDQNKQLWSPTSLDLS